MNKTAYKKVQIVAHVVEQATHHSGQMDDVCWFMLGEQLFRLGQVAGKVQKKNWKQRQVFSSLEAGTRATQNLP